MGGRFATKTSGGSAAKTTGPWEPSCKDCAAWVRRPGLDGARQNGALPDEIEGEKTVLRTLNLELQKKETAREELNRRSSTPMDSHAKDRQTLDARFCEVLQA